MNAIGAPFVVREKRARQSYLKMMVYGGTGAGKTFLAGTSADVSGMRDVIMLSAEGGDMTLDANIYNFENIDIVDVSVFSEVSAFVQYMRSHCAFRDLGTPEADTKLAEAEARLKGCSPSEVLQREGGPKRYRTVIIDSLSEIDTIHQNKLLGINSGSPLDLDGADSSWDTYRQNLMKIQRFVKQLRDLPIHTIFTCIDTWSQDAQKRYQYRPKLAGQLSSSVQGDMDVVGYLEVGDLIESGSKEAGEGEGGSGIVGHIPRRLWVMPTRGHQAKNRWPLNKKPYLLDPVMKDILEAGNINIK